MTESNEDSLESFQDLLDSPSICSNDFPLSAPSCPTPLNSIWFLSVMSWNANGFFNVMQRKSKFGHLRKFSNFLKCDIILLQETHVNESFHSWFNTKIPHFQWIVSPLPRSNHGLAIGIRKSKSSSFIGNPFFSPSGLFFSTEAKIQNSE